jgi:subtilisin family serine protease
MECIMLGLGTECGLLDYCFRVSHKLLKLSNRGRKSPGVLLRRDRHIRRRLLKIEPLECRALMSADGLSSLISPIWFQDCSTANQPSHAGVATWTAESIAPAANVNSGSVNGQTNVYDWIVQFDTNALNGITQLAQTTTLLAGAGINFQVIRGLGLEGQELVRSMGSSFDAVEQWFSHDTYIAGFEQDAVRQADKISNDPSMSQLWGMTKIDAQDAWNITTGATGANRVVVAVIDTGVDYTHPDLAANIWTNTAEIAGNGADDDHDGFVDDVHGYNFVSNNGNPMDDNGHGTHVSGTIAAVGNNSLGVAGVNWSASIMALKFMDSTGSGYLSDAIRAINYATMERTQYGVNVRVINASWGGGGFSSAMQTAIQAANDAGIMFVAAAGNSGTNNDVTAQYPANYTPPNVISVAASDQNDQLASFSCYGATTVDLAAPGVSIYSTVPNNRYAYYSGTSMATPMVSGVAALAWAYKPNATVADIRSAILQGVDKISSLSGKVASGGRLDAYNTLKLLGGAAPSLPVLGSLLVNPASTVTKGASVTLVAQATASSTGVSAVYYYQDTNGNGAYDNGDTCIGYDNTVVNGTAEFAVNTSGMTTGTSRFFARAIDKNGQWSAALSATLTIVAPDDYGNNAAGAAAIAVGSTISGSIETGGDQDWFKFQAVAGKKYVISTTLAGLTDSVLTLYAGNGTTQLAYNDDIASNNPASRIQWTAPASGTYFIKTTAYDTHQTGGYKLSLTLQNSPPVLQTISDQILSNKAGGLTIPIAASDADGDHLALSATAYTVDAKTQSHVSVPGSKAALTLSGNQLRITRDASYTGVFYVDVTASDGINTVLKSFKVTATNATQQWLVGSSVSSLSLGEDLSQGAALPLPTTAAAATTPEANRQVAGGNGLSQACSSYIIYPGMQSNSLSLLHTGISAQAAESAFHESNFQGESWMPDGTAHVKNISCNTTGRGDRILDLSMNRVIGNIAQTSGENTIALDNVPDAKHSRGIEEALDSWDNQSSESGSFDEFFALLGLR